MGARVLWQNSNFRNSQRCEVVLAWRVFMGSHKTRSYLEFVGQLGWTNNL